MINFGLMIVLFGSVFGLISFGLISFGLISFGLISFG